MLTDHDELEHVGVDTESWWWWGAAADQSAGVFVGLQVRGRRFDYRAGLWRVGRSPLYIEEIDGVGRRAGLELKPPEMWADHACDVPYRQWSVGNEAHGVLLEDPAEALGRPYGTPVPVTFDIEWYAAGEPTAIAGGYEQAGEIDAQVELTEGVVHLVGPAGRMHTWGAQGPPELRAMLTLVGWLPPTVGH